MTMGTDWDESSLPYSNPPTARSPWTRRPTATATSWSGASSCSPASAGPTAAARPRCSPAHRQGHGQAAAHVRPRGAVRSARARPHRVDRRRNGEPYAASGLRMAPRDLARIGMTMAEWRHGGRTQSCRHNGSSAARPRSWPSTRCAAMAITGMSAISPSASRRAGRRGVSSPGGAPSARAASGCWCCPTLKLVLAVTAGNYGTEDQWIPRPACCARSCWQASFEARLRYRQVAS